MPLNVLHVISDQHQAALMGHEGHRQVITPHMDRLAAQGVRFTRAFTQNPICTPSRVSILSGQYPHNHGYFGLSGPRPAALPSYLSHFRGYGYRTAGVGNLHTPNVPRNWLENHLDLFLDYHESVDGVLYQTPFYDKLRTLGLLEKEDMYFAFHNPKTFLEGFPSALPFELSQEGWCVQEAIKFMDGCGASPFCMQVSLTRPHQPFTPAKQFWDLYDEDLALPATLNQDPAHRPPHFQNVYRWFHQAPEATIEPKTFEGLARRLWRGYLGCITHVDHALGLLLDYLERTGKADNTVVIYNADHGGFSGTHGIPEKAPGIGSEAVCRVPFLWRVPEAGPEGPGLRGQVCTELVENIDIAPTITALCGLPAMDTVDGKDISALVRGQVGAVREIAVTEHIWSKSLRLGQWRYVHYQQAMFEALAAVGGPKPAHDDVGELYDMDADPDETRNLYNDPAHQQVVQECQRHLLDWLIRTTRPVTLWPPPGGFKLGEGYSAVAGDGKVSNQAGVGTRLQRGDVYYI